MSTRKKSTPFAANTPEPAQMAVRRTLGAIGLSQIVETAEQSNYQRDYQEASIAQMRANAEEAKARARLINAQSAELELKNKAGIDNKMPYPTPATADAPSGTDRQERGTDDIEHSRNCSKIALKEISNAREHLMLATLFLNIAKAVEPVEEVIKLNESLGMVTDEVRSLFKV